MNNGTWRGDREELFLSRVSIFTFVFLIRTFFLKTSKQHPSKDLRRRYRYEGLASPLQQRTETPTDSDSLYKGTEAQLVIQDWGPQGTPGLVFVIWTEIRPWGKSFFFFQKIQEPNALTTIDPFHGDASKKPKRSKLLPRKHFSPIIPEAPEF